MDTQKTIIVTNTYRAIGKKICALLNSNGYCAEYARTWRQLKHLVSDEKPTCILLDMDTPEVNSESVAILKHLAPPTIIILLVSEVTKLWTKDAIKNGAYFYLNKPLDEQQMLLTIARALSVPAEEKITNSAIKAFIQVNPDPMGILQGNNIIISNKKFCDLFEYPPQEVKEGIPFLKLVQEKDKALVAKRYKARQAGEEIKNNYRLDLKTKSNRIINCEIFSSRINYNGNAASLVSTRDISSRVHSQELLEIQRDLGTALCTSRCLEETLDLILAAALKLKEIDSGGIYLLNPGEGSLHLAAHCGFSRSFIKSVANFGADTPQTQVVMAGKPVYERHTSLSPNMDDILQAEGLHAIAVIPVLYEGKIIAAMNLASHHSDTIPADTKNALETLGTQVAGVLAMAKTQEQSQLTQFAIDHASDPIFWLRKDATVFYANDAACIHSGFDKAYLEAQNIHTLFPGLSQKRWHEYYEPMVRNGVVHLEAGLMSKAGITRPMEITANFMEFDGKAYVCAFARDITQRIETEKQLTASLDEKELLLREIHHRVKNNMQIISSLINLQSKHVKTKKALALFRDSQHRIRAMALIHEILYRSSNIGHIDFQFYIQHLTSNLLNAFGTNDGHIQYKANIENIPFDVDDVVPAGLIINELMSNALKYAFPEKASGTIEINIHRTHDKEIRMEVKDDGKGLPPRIKPESGKTLGLHLVKTLCENQLQGRLTIHRTQGTHFIIEFRPKHFREHGDNTF